MRSLQLVRIAAQAEGLRLRRLARRQVGRAILGATAGVFGLALIACLHVAAVLALTNRVQPLYAVLIVAGVDLLVAGALGLMAAHDSPSRVEREALIVRQNAQTQLMETAATVALVGPVLRRLGGRKVYGLALAALTARYLGIGRR